MTAVVDTGAGNGDALARARALLNQRLYEAAERCAREALAGTDQDTPLLVLLTQILRERGKGDEALQLLDEAAARDPSAIVLPVYRGLVHLDRRDFPAAIRAFADAVGRAPQIGEHHRLLGVARRGAGDFDGAARAFETAARLAPQEPAALVDLATLLEELNQPQAALVLLERSLATIGAHRLLVEATIRALRRRGRHRDAAGWIERLLADNPDVAWLQAQMGATLESFDRERANVFFARARELDPNNTRLLLAHADSLNRTRGPKEAENIAQAYRLARERLKTPLDLRRDAHVLLGLFIRNADYEAVATLGRFEELGATFSAHGRYASLHLLLTQARTAPHRRLLIDWHRRCGATMVAAARRAPLAPPPAPPIVGRAKIRVGLMSSDLRDHPVGHFVWPLARHYDRDRFEFYAYSWFTGPPDAMQRALAGQFDQFRHHAPIGDRDAAQLIANDRLDVLFDLGGATDMNKLAALAWRPAPRVASWLGYPHSAGLETIDRILVDPYLEPRDPALLIEKPFRLARSWVAFERHPGVVDPAIAPAPPSRRTGRLTFGTMNNPQKYNPALIAAWAEVLRRTPGSRFLFVRPEGAVDSFRANIVARFESHGVAGERIAFTPVRGHHLPHYNEIDVALDTFPQTGGTTTCETLWMGTPVVSLVGEAFFERLSCSNLFNAGLPDLAVQSVDAYVDKAIAIALAEDWRQELRRTMRQRLSAHPLGDGRRFAHDFTEAVTTWREERP